MIASFSFSSAHSSYASQSASSSFIMVVSSVNGCAAGCLKPTDQAGESSPRSAAWLDLTGAWIGTIKQPGRSLPIRKAMQLEFFFFKKHQTRY